MWEMDICTPNTVQSWDMNIRVYTYLISLVSNYTANTSPVNYNSANTSLVNNYSDNTTLINNHSAISP